MSKDLRWKTWRESALKRDALERQAQVEAVLGSGAPLTLVPDRLRSSGADVSILSLPSPCRRAPRGRTLDSLMPSERDVLAHLTCDELLATADRFELEVAGRRAREQIVEASVGGR